MYEFGADVSKAQFYNNATPLYSAAREGHTEIVRMLLTHGQADANLALADDGFTPLHAAAENGHTEVARMLIMDGRAEIDQPDAAGWRPFFWAALHVRAESCFSLGALGADLDLERPMEGQSPLVIEDPSLAEWIRVIRDPPYGTALKIALERRDHVAAMFLLQSRRTGPLTAGMIRNELLPIASTVPQTHLARPVCVITRRVAEVAEQLYANRWSTRVHALCEEPQRKAAIAVLIIMRRARRGAAAGEGADLPHQHPLQDAGPWGDLPPWMYEVVEDVWWKVLEMMGRW